MSDKFSKEEMKKIINVVDFLISILEESHADAYVVLEADNIELKELIAQKVTDYLYPKDGWRIAIGFYGSGYYAPKHGKPVVIYLNHLLDFADRK